MERLQIVDGNDTVLDFGTLHDKNSSSSFDYKSGYISGYGSETFGSSINKIFDIYGGNKSKSGILNLYKANWFETRSVITIGGYDKGGYIDFFDKDGKFSKSIKAE